jgi:hypothetical protein
MKLTTTQDKTLTTISALVHGDSGVGKTTSLATLPEDKTLMVLTERGALPLRNKGFPVLRPKTWDDVISIPGMIANPDAIEDEAIKTAVKACRIVVVDSLSATAELCARHIIEVDRARLVQDRTGGKESTPKGIYSEQLAQEDYGLLRTRVKNFCSSLTSLPINVIMTCGSVWIRDQHTGINRYAPQLAGKTAMEIPAYFDLVLFMESTPEGTRQWRTFNDGTFIAKDASGVLENIESPNWTAIFAKILKGA